MRELPQNKFFERFYIWFDKDKKEEYYATPLYMHNTNTHIDYDNRKVKIFLQKYQFDGLLYPGLIYFPYSESFGMMFLMFLNADFTTFETAYKNFFYAYGYELLKDYAPNGGFQTRYKTEKELVKMMEIVYEDSKCMLMEMQQNFRECVDYIYNLNGNNQLQDYKTNSKFIAYVISHQNDIYTYTNRVEVFLDSYADQDKDYQNESIKSLVERIENGELHIQKHNVYTSEKLSNILFLILEEVTQIENLPIKQCQNCGKYFIPTSRQDEVYCEFQDEKGKTCKEKGAIQTYKKNLENIPALLEYRRSYQKKIMIVSRNKDNKQLKKDFEKWKKEAQAKIKLFKQGKLEQDVLYDWMINNK